MTDNVLHISLLSSTLKRNFRNIMTSYRGDMSIWLFVVIDSAARGGQKKWRDVLIEDSLTCGLIVV